MNWAYVTLAENDAKLYVNLDRVHAVYDNPTGTTTIIFGPDDFDYYEVKEKAAAIVRSKL